MKQYLDLLKELQAATVKDNRTGISASSKFFNHIEFDIAKDGLPIVTTKQLAVKSVIGELLGFIRGSSDNAEFNSLKCKVWNDNANNHGTDMEGNLVENRWLSNPFRKGEDDLGRIYGVQWRDWDHTTYIHENDPDAPTVGDMENLGYEHMGLLLSKGLHVYRKKVDQLKWAISELINNPLNRRILISAWNPGDMDKMSLPPCHLLQHYQCMPMSLEERIEYAHQNIEGYEELLLDSDDPNGVPVLEAELDIEGVPKYTLNLMIYIRSNDVCLGTPFNMASYAIMLEIMSRLTGHAVGTLHYVTGDTHIYTNHGDAIKEQLERTPIENKVTLEMNPNLKTLEDFEKATPDDFKLVNYEHCGKLNSPTPMAI